MSEKTPIPWFTSDEGRFMNVKGDNGVIIAVRHRNPTPVHVEDMKFIVTAVNSHAALLEVKRCAEELSWGQNKHVQEYWTRLEAALQSAGGIQ